MLITEQATWRSAVKRNMSTSSPDYIELAKKRAYLGGEGTIQHALDTYKLDALVVPSTESVCAIAALNGYPMISIPLAYVFQVSVLTHLIRKAGDMQTMLLARLIPKAELSNSDQTQG